MSMLERAMRVPGLRAHTFDRFGSVLRTAGSSNTVVLTYDDGPTPGVTELILDVLSSHNVTATFFVLTNRARKASRLLARTAEEGHEIGLHGPDHRRLTRLDPSSVGARMRQARDELEQLSGAPVRHFRPPYGAQSFRTWTATRETGLVPVMWSSALRDWMPLSADEQVRGVTTAIRPGAIILAHDGFAGLSDGVDDGPEPPIDRPAVSSLLLGRLSDAGIRAVSLRDALQDSRPVHEPWFRG